MAERMTAKGLILAGTRPGGDPLAQAMEVSHKALIEVAGMPMLARVIDAARNAGLAEVMVATDCDAVASLARECGALVRASLAGPSASVAAVLAEAGPPLVVTTSDHALLQPQWIAELIAGAGQDADVAVMMAERDAIEAAVADTKRTYLRMADGCWSGCNLFYLRTPHAERAVEQWQAIEADRKRPWKIAGKLGFATLLHYATGRLAMDRAIEAVGARMGVRARLVVAGDGLAAVDVDKREDIAIVDRFLQERKR